MQSQARTSLSTVENGLTLRLTLPEPISLSSAGRRNTQTSQSFTNNNTMSFHNLSDDDLRVRYGRNSELLPLASTNPRALYPYHIAHPPEKRVFPIACPSLSDHKKVYDRLIEPAVMESLCHWNLLASDHTSSTRSSEGERGFLSLHPIRFGFTGAEFRTELDVTLLIIVSKGSVSRQKASDIVTDLEARIKEICIENDIERIFVDLCEPLISASELRSSKNQVSNLAKGSPRTVDEILPRIGASIGRADSELTGTLGFYLQYNGRIFAVTNHHVVDLPSELPYHYKQGESRIAIVSPSSQDRKTIKEDFQVEIKEFEDEIQKLQQDIALCQAQGRDWSTRKSNLLTMHRESRQQKLLVLAWLDNPDTIFGFLEATSGLLPPPKDVSRKDWALIEANNSLTQFCPNLFRSIKTSRHPYQVGNREQSELEFRIDSNDISDQIKAAELRFRIDNAVPIFPSLHGSLGKNDSELFLKPPSARSLFRHGTFNSLRHTINMGPCGMTREYAFINPGGSIYSRVSEQGDSGSCVLSMRDFGVVGMLWGGGWDPADFLGWSGRDVTYVSPLADTIQDIETSMGWAPGSCKFLAS